MKDFLKLISFLISMLGCLVVGGALALKGAPLLTIAWRAATALLALWIVLSFLTSVLSMVAAPPPAEIPPEAEEAEDDQLMAEVS